MKKLIFTSILAFTVASIYAQTVSTFENITLASNSYNNGFASVSQVTKFTSGNASFVNAYDTSFGGYWGGCAISNIKDSVNGTYANQYASIANGGYNGSNNYATFFQDYNPDNNKIILNGNAIGRPVKGCYITNSTWAYKEMLNGGTFTKKFGGTTGNDPDYFYVTFTGWYNGVATSNKVDFYLANFKDTNNANDYIVKDWQWVDLSSLGNLDSLTFVMSSSDTGSFGINTPTYFCVDNFTTTDVPASVNNVSNINLVSVYPNPASSFITINVANKEQAIIVNSFGAIINKYQLAKGENNFNISNLPNGIYFIKTTNGSLQFIKQ